MPGVTTAAPHISSRIHSLNRPNLVSIGTIVWLASELMFFAGLFAMYFTARAQNDGPWPPEPTHLNVPYALTITTILVASSFTCQFGVFAAERGDVFGLRRWYLLTLLMGTIFVVGQAYEYVLLVEEGTTIASSAYGSVFYMATGFHGLHVATGVFLMGLMLVKSFIPGNYAGGEQGVQATSLFWHFVDVIWIILFLLIYVWQRS